MRPQRPDGVAQLYVPPVERDAVLLYQRSGHVLVRDRAEEAALLAHAGGDVHLERLEARRQLLGLRQAAHVFLLPLALQLLQALHLPGVGLDDHAAGQQEVTGVPGRDFFDVADPAQVIDVFEQDDFHG